VWHELQTADQRGRARPPRVTQGHRRAGD